jgi:NAD(P) transhydrogenase subunit alpha
MTIGVLKEPAHETRVSLLAEAIATLTKKGITVMVESGAGEKAFCSNTDYEKAGAQVKSRHEVVDSSDIIEYSSAFTI